MNEQILNEQSPADPRKRSDEFAAWEAKIDEEIRQYLAAHEGDKYSETYC